MQSFIRLTFFLSVSFCRLSALAEVASSVALSSSQDTAEPEVKPKAERLLAQMSVALKTVNYAGEFTYEYGSKLESFRIVHQIVDGHQIESLQKLTGADRRVVREGDPACGTIGRHLLAGARLSASDGARYGLDRFYVSSVLGQDRIAGRDAWVIQLLPRDEHRFGLLLAVDQSSSLLLRHVIFDTRKKVALERTQFISLQLGEASTALEGATGVAKERCITDTYSPDGHSPWKPSWLPPGFVLTGYEYHRDDGHMETYTDGVSSFSVFVKQGGAATLAEGQINQGVSSHGASMALITSLSKGGQTQHISVVGEIPLPAAQKISLSVKKITQTDSVGS